MRAACSINILVIQFFCSCGDKGLDAHQGIGAEQQFYEGFLSFEGRSEKRLTIGGDDVAWLEKLAARANDYDRQAVESEAESPVRKMGGYLRIPKLSSDEIGFSRNEKGLILLRQDHCMISLLRYDFLSEKEQHRFINFINRYTKSPL